MHNTILPAGPVAPRATAMVWPVRTNIRAIKAARIGLRKQCIWVQYPVRPGLSGDKRKQPCGATPQGCFDKSQKD